MHLSALFQALAARHRDRIAIRDVNGELTYADFVARMFRLGSGLHKAGITTGSAIGLLLPDVRAYLEADYGIMVSGFVRVPLDPRLAEAEMLAQLELAEAKAIVTTAAQADRIAVIRERLPGIVVVCIDGGMDGALDFEALIAAGDPDAWTKGSPDDLAALNFSGGTTGRPKATMIRHCNLAAVLQTVPKGFGISKDDVFLNIRPLWPIAQVIVMSHFAAGATVVLGGRFEAERFADQIRDSEATRSSLVPTQLVRVLDFVERDDPRLARLAAIYVGGSRLPPATFQRALDLLGPRIGILYGLTEAPITTYLPPQDFATQDAVLRERLMGSSGYVLDGYRIELGEGGSELAEDGLGRSGEVVIHGGNVMAGYWKEPELTEQALRDGHLHTNDLGAFDAQGRLYIVGRLKDVIRTGASSVLPKEVEDVIATHPAVAEVAVTGLPDEEWGEIVTAFITLREGQAVGEQDIIAHCGTELTRFKRPKRVIVVDEIPRSHYGKVLKPQLLEKAGMSNR